MTQTLVLICILPISIEVSVLVTYGGLISDSKYLSYISLRLPTLQLNSLDNNIMMNFDDMISLPGISIHLFPIYTKWYMRGIGRIPRWTKMHRLLENKHKELLLNN